VPAFVRELGAFPSAELGWQGRTLAEHADHVAP